MTLNWVVKRQGTLKQGCATSQYTTEWQMWSHLDLLLVVFAYAPGQRETCTFHTHIHTPHWHSHTHRAVKKSEALVECYRETWQYVPFELAVKCITQIKWHEWHVSGLAKAIKVTESNTAHGTKTESPYKAQVCKALRFLIITTKKPLWSVQSYVNKPHSTGKTCCINSYGRP